MRILYHTVPTMQLTFATKYYDSNYKYIVKNSYCTQYLMSWRWYYLGKTSSIVKDRYNAKAYDEIKVRVPKGKKEIIKSYAESKGESVNGFINRIIDEEMELNKICFNNELNK